MPSRNCKYLEAKNFINTMIVGLRSIHIYVFFVPEAFKNLPDAFWDLARITAIINNSQDSKHELGFCCFIFLIFFGDVGVVTRFSQRRFDTQTALRTAAFIRSYTQKGLRKEKLLQTDASTHREAFVQRGCYTHTSFQTPKLYTKMLHSAACTHRRLYTQTRSHTHTNRRFLHIETIAQNSFWRQKFSSPRHKIRQAGIRA